ncbi:Hypothetical predicted protein, partial [Olea europaea subsp. europaea]
CGDGMSDAPYLNDKSGGYRILVLVVACGDGRSDAPYFLVGGFIVCGMVIWNPLAFVDSGGGDGGGLIL